MDTINYKNEFYEGEIIWTRGDVLIEGLYTFNFFINCDFIGSTTASERNDKDSTSIFSSRVILFSQYISGELLGMLGRPARSDLA